MIRVVVDNESDAGAAGDDGCRDEGRQLGGLRTHSEGKMKGK